MRRLAAALVVIIWGATFFLLVHTAVEQRDMQRDLDATKARLSLMSEVVDDLSDDTEDLRHRVTTLEGSYSQLLERVKEFVRPSGTLNNCTVTYYCAEQYPHICNAGPPFGLTASGNNLQPYVSCAVDPKVIPFGSDVIVEFVDGTLWHLVAHDTGGAIKGNHIDIAVATHQEALSLGKDIATVYWYE